MTNDKEMSIPDFYRGRCIFMTGATGFMGKVLVHKLLTDCGDLERLYILVRTKKGVEPQQRLDEYVNHMVSQRSKSELLDPLSRSIVFRKLRQTYVLSTW